MNCHEAEILLLAFLSAELSTSDKQELEEHLCACRHCRTELRSLKSFNVIYSRMEINEPPEQLNAQIISMAAQSLLEPQTPPVPVRRRSYRSLFYTGVAASLILSVSVWMWLPDQVQNSLPLQNPPANTVVAPPVEVVQAPDNIPDPTMDIAVLHQTLNRMLATPVGVNPQNNRLIPIASEVLPMANNRK